MRFNSTFQSNRSASNSYRVLLHGRLADGGLVQGPFGPEEANKGTYGPIRNPYWPHMWMWICVGIQDRVVATGETRQSMHGYSPGVELHRHGGEETEEHAPKDMCVLRQHGFVVQLGV